jgi:hypothetical protein
MPVAVALTTAVLLVGCGNGDTDRAGRSSDGKDARTRTGGDATASPAATAATEMSHSEVRAGIAAGMRAGGFSEPRFGASEDDGGFGVCVVSGETSTETDPSPKDTALLAGELKRQGWVQEFFWTEEGMTTLAMRNGVWKLDIAGGTLPKEEVAKRLPEDERAAARDFTGLSVTAVDLACQDRVYKSLSS